MRRRLWLVLLVLLVIPPGQGLGNVLTAAGTPTPSPPPMQRAKRIVTGVLREDFFTSSTVHPTVTQRASHSLSPLTHSSSTRAIPTTPKSTPTTTTPPTLTTRPPTLLTTPPTRIRKSPTTSTTPSTNSPTTASSITTTTFPSVSTRTPTSSTMTTFPKTPSPFTKTPSPFTKTPSPFTKTPSPFTKTPSPFTKTPWPVTESPPATTPGHYPPPVTVGRRPRAEPAAVVAVAAAGSGAGSGAASRRLAGPVAAAAAAPPPAGVIEAVDSSHGHAGNTAVDEALAGVSDNPLPASFGTENSTRVVAQLGGNAFLPCVVYNIGDGVVSWIRRKDYHLLTVGVASYTRDARYEMVHAQHSDEWTLKIKFVQDRDAGLYECQVSSHPPTSNFIELRVVEARAEIAGSAEKYLKVGSSLRLECALRQSTAPPLYIFWYHNNLMINYNSGVNVTADKEAKTSTLFIAAAQRADSGNYSCVPNNAQPASTYVHILNAGENPAAMQHGLHGLAWLRSPSSWLLLACVLLSACGGVGGVATSPRTLHPPRRRRPAEP